MKISVDTGSLAVVVTIVFVILKLVGVIGWAWVWVLAPLWISCGIGVAALIIIGFIAAVLGLFALIFGR